MARFGGVHPTVYAIIIFLAGYGSWGAPLPASMVGEFFAAKKVGVVYLKPCSSSEALRLTRYLNIQCKFFTKVLRSVPEMIGSDGIQQDDDLGRAGIVIDLTCEANRRFFEDAASAEQFGLRWSWLVDAGTEGGMDFISNINLGFVNDITVVTQNVTDPPNLALHHAYTQQWPRKEMITTAVGFWRMAEGLVYHPPRREYSLEGRTLHAAIFITQDIYHDDQIYNELQNKTYMPSLDNANRFYFAVGLHIADLLNYSIELVKSNDWGDRLPNGSYSGMLGMLKTGSADLSVGPIRLATERMDAASPLFPIQRFMFPFVFKQPKRTGTYKALALQLQTDVWVYTGLIAAIIAMTLSAIHWLRNHVKRRQKKEYFREEEEYLSYNAVLVIGALCQQGEFQPSDGIMENRH